MLKKTLLIIAGLLFVFAPTVIFAQEEELPTDTDAGVEATSEVNEEEEVSGESEDDSTDEAKKFVIYVDKTCPHCRDVKEFVEDNGLEDNVEYIELYQNEENYNQLVALWDENGVPDSERGWPYLVVSEDPYEAIVGGQPIIDFLTEEFNIDTSQSESDNAGNTALLLVGGVVILGVLGYGIYTILGSTDKKK